MTNCVFYISVPKFTLTIIKVINISTHYLKMNNLLTFSVYRISSWPLQPLTSTITTKCTLFFLAAWFVWPVTPLFNHHVDFSSCITLKRTNIIPLVFNFETFVCISLKTFTPHRPFYRLLEIKWFWRYYICRHYDH